MKILLIAAALVVIVGVALAAPEPNISYEVSNPADRIGVAGNTSPLNVSINVTEMNLANFTWNGTTYTIFNNSVIFMSNFDNLTALGEGDTVVDDVSPLNLGCEARVNATVMNTSKYGKARKFTGTTNSYVNCTVTSAFINNSAGLTVAAWVYPNSSITQDTYGSIFDKGVSAGAPFVVFSLARNATTQRWAWQMDTSNTIPLQAIFSTKNMTNNTWQFVAGTYNSTDYCIWMDGAVDVCSNLTGTLSENLSYNLVIGDSRTKAGSNAWGGGIDEPVIFNRALSAAEIDILYKSHFYKKASTEWNWEVNQSGATGVYTYSFCAANSTVGVCTSTRQLAFGALQCSTLNTAGATSTMTGDIASNGASCFTMTGANSTLQCSGYRIVSNNTLGAIGINLNASNITVINCAVEGFQYGYFLNTTATISTLVNDSAAHGKPPTCTGNNCVGNPIEGFRFQANSLTLTNLTVSNLTGGQSAGSPSGAAGGYACGIYFDASNSSILTTGSISNLTGGQGGDGSSGKPGGDAYGICTFNSQLNAIINVAVVNLTGGAGGTDSVGGAQGGSGGTPYGAYLVSSSNNSISSNNFTFFTGGTGGDSVDAQGGNGGQANGVALIGSLNNTITGNLVRNLTQGAKFCRDTCGVDGNTTSLNLTANSTANVLLTNNLSSQIWVSNGNATNILNNSTVGNIYYNTTGAGAWIKYSITTGSPPNWATGGTNLPFNASLVGGEWVGQGLDGHPWTETATVSLSCGNLSTAGFTYTMTSNLVSNGSTCFTVTAQNVTLNMAGYSVTSNNTTATYGLYSDQLNTTVKNGFFTLFHHGVFLSGASNGLIQNITANGSSSSGHAINIDGGANNNTVLASVGIANTNGDGIRVQNSFNVSITNSTGTSNTGVGISTRTTANNTIISGSNGTSTTSNGMLLQGRYASVLNAYARSTSGNAMSTTTSVGHTINNSVGNSSTGVGILLSGNFTYIINSIGQTYDSDIPLAVGISFNTGDNNNASNVDALGNWGGAVFTSGADNNRLLNSRIRALLNDTTVGGVWFAGAASGNIIANSTISSNSLDAVSAVIYADASVGAVSSNQIINNTLTGGSNITLVYMGASAGGNTFYWNNFTGTGIYVNDTNGTNWYNATEGNFWQNVQNGIVAITGTVASSGFAGQYLGTVGAGYPYNQTTSASRFFCSQGCGDFVPLTPFLTAAPSNTCVYGGSGNWILNMADNCNITTSYNLGANTLIYNGTGTVTFYNATDSITITAKKAQRANVSNIFKKFIKSKVFFTFTG